MADGYGDSGLMTNEPVLSLDEIIRRNRAIRARKDEIQRREDELRRLAEQQDASKLEDPGSVEGRQRHKEAMRKGPVYQAPTPKPTTVNVDGTDMPYDEAVSKIPDQMDFEQKLLSSPLAKLALRRRRIEDLVTDEGKSQEEAEQIALEEQQGRAAAFTLGQETIRNSPGYMPKEVRALGSGLTNSAIAMGARVFGLNQVADEAEATRAGISSEMSGIRDAQHPYPEVMGALSGAAESSIQMLPGMIASPVVGPTAGMAIMSGQFGTQEYSNAKYEGAEAGLSGDELNRYATIQGGVEAAIMPIFSKIPGLAGLEGRVLQQNIARTMASNPKLRQAIAEGAFKLGKDVSAELAEEITTEVLHGFATEGGLNQKVNYSQVIKDTVLQTLVMMGSAQVGESIGSVASKGDLFGMRKPQSDATPVFPDQQPAEDPNSFTQIPIDEMIQRRDAAAGSQQTIPPEVEAFTANPSRKKYEAAVKAGLPPLTKSTETTRKQYASDLLSDPFGMRKPDLSGSSPPPGTATPPAATPDPATLEPVSETNPETVPDKFYDEVLNLYLKKGDPNGQIQASKNADEAEGQQVQTKELLNDLPAGTQDPAPPAEVNESPTPAAHTNREDFEKDYNETLARLDSFEIDDPARIPDLSRMEDLFDAHPEWAQEIEKSKTPPVVAPGGALPDQPSSPMFDPVSSNETPSGQSQSEVPRPSTKEEHSQLPVFSVYQTQFNGKPKFAVKQNDKGGFGDALFDTESDANQYASVVKQQSDDAMARREKAQADEEAATKKQQEHEASFQGFLTDDPKTKGRRLKTLDTLVNYEKKPITRKSLVEKRVADGWTVNDQDQLQAPTGEFLDAGALTKTGIDYARHLVSKSSNSEKAVPWRRTVDEERPAYNKRLKKEGWTPSPKPDITMISSPGTIKSMSLEDVKKSPYKKGDRVTVITGFSTDEMQIGGEVLEDSHPELPQVKVRVDSGKVHNVMAYYIGRDEKAAKADPEPSAAEHDRLYKELQPLYRDPKHKAGDREHMERIRDLEQQVEFHKPAAVARAQAEIDAEAKTKEPKFEYGDVIERIDDPKIIGRFEGKHKNGDLIVKYDGGRTTWTKGNAQKSSVVLDDQGRRVAPPAKSQMTDIEAAMAAELDRQEAEEAAAKKPAKPKTPKTKKPVFESGTPMTRDTVFPDATPKPPRTAVGEKLGELSTKTGDARKAAVAAFLAEANKGGAKSLMPGAVNPKAVVLAATMARAFVADGTVKFADFVMKFAEDTSPAIARQFSDYLEAAWKMIGQRSPELDLDPAGKVADLLGPEKATNDEDTTSTRDESVGGMPIESEGELAPETGGTSTGGNSEDVSGSDSGSLSGRTDSTEGSESDAAGEFTEGNDSGSDVGEKPKPGRKPSVKGSRKPAGGVQGKVEPTNNLRIQPGDTIAPKGEVGKLKANIAAIKLLKTLTAENRPATDDEKRVLMQYTGWGSLQHAFDEFRGNAYIAKPGLAEPFGADYKKSQLYASKKKGEYLSPEELRNRAEAWESKWGESYRYLKENLTKDEFKKAYASVENAHFTSRDVITHGIWGALEQMGVTGGRFMEPSSGIGSLIGLMPDAIANNSEVLAIELDSLTGEMVRKLYPDADVHVKGFEEVPIPPGTIDIAATNVPFHQIGPVDAETRYGRPMNLHNYFIARILDSLRPGGIAAVISTHFTMDANPQDRALLASKADLVGAIRLPNNAFKANAGTEVTTDILFFRKPDGSPFKSEAWQNMLSVGTHVVPVKNKKGVKTGEKTVPMVANEYFANHPEMVLGTHSMAGKMRAAEDSGEEYTLLPIPDAVLADQLKTAVAHLPDGIATTDNAPLMPSLDTSTSGVDGRVEFRNGKLQEWSNKAWVAPLWIKDHIDLRKDGKPRKDVKPATRAAKLANAMTRAIAYTKVRNAYESHIHAMRSPETSDAEYAASQKSLNDNYDAYRKAHGPINDTESEFLERDPGFFQIAGLEIEAEKRVAGKRIKSYAKADVFRERTLNPDAVPEKADSTEEAVKISLAWRGSINLPWMSALTGTPEADLRTELLASGAVFENPETGMLEPADTYLAGNVQAKLRAAEQAVKDGNSAISKNVEFLKQVQPPRASIDSITPSLGENWIGAELTQQWVHEVMGLKDAVVKYNEKGDIWSVSGYTYGAPQDIQNDWGGLKSPVVSLLNKVLNGASTQVMKKVPTGKFDKKGNEIEATVVDEAQTQAAQIKAEKMRAAFLKWAKTEESVIPKIEQAYNEQKNFYVKPIWNGEHLTFPGMSESWVKQIRPYQKNTIWRGIREGRGMIAHGVGAGKTAEIIAIAMEMKRLGTATKPMIVVQNSTLGQFARTFTQIYPTAKVLVATSEDLDERNRAKFMARVATGNWDSIVMAKSTFNEKLPNDPVREQQMVEGLIDELKDILLENALADGAGSPSVKAIQQQITSLEKRLKKIIERAHARQDTDVFFEQMGVDALFLDEAHDYKKPPFVTKLDKKIKGITNETSARALNALIKMRFVQDNNKGRNTFMATGTPITNTLGEAWLLMNMVAPDVTREFGVTTFDRFVGMFATVSVTQEQDPVGKLRRVTRLAKFKNGRQLGQFISAGWDVLLGADLHDKIREYGGGKIPTIKGGKDQLYLVDRSPAFNRFAEFFNQVYNAFKNLEGKDKRLYSWVPISIYGAAQAAAIDIRLVDPTAPDDPGSKINKMVAGVSEAYREGNDKKLTQLIFSDLSGRRSMDKLKDFADGTGVELEAEEVQYDEDGNEIETPAPDTTKEDRWLYQEIKRKLVEQGIPEAEVQIINDYVNPKKPELLLEFMERVNTGEVRIVIGHSDTLGTGVNVQERLWQIWHLDIPMVPAKKQQRDGRGIRSGNMNDEIVINMMAMQKSLDTTLMDMNVRKAKAAEQALSGKAGNEFDDPFSASLMSMQDMQAAMNDDPYFYRKSDLEFKIRNLLLDKEALDQQKSQERWRLRENETNIKSNADSVQHYTVQADKIADILKANHPITVEGKVVKNAAEAEKALKKQFKEQSERISELTQAGTIPALGEYANPKSEHIAAEVEFGPVQFTLYYGERPEVVQDADGNPSTKWTSSSGTIATTEGKQLFDKHITSFSTIMEKFAGEEQWHRQKAKDAADYVLRKTSENNKLRDFLAKPYESQNELDNLQSELAQINALMYARDNPTATPVPSTATPDPSAGSAEAPISDARKAANEAKEALYILRSKNARFVQIMQDEWANIVNSAPMLPLTDEMARALAGYTVGSIRAGIKRFDAFIKELRANLDEAAITHVKPNIIEVWNSLRPKYKLDEATDELFDAAMSNTVDVDIEKAVEAAKAAPPAESQNSEPPIAENSPGTPPELPLNSPDPATQPTATGDGAVNFPDDSRTIPGRWADSPDADEPTIGINKAKRAERRKELGLAQEDIVSKVGHSFPELDAEAKKVSPGEAEDVFTRIGAGGEAADNASDRDVFVMLNHYAGKLLATTETLNERKAAQEAGDDFRVVELDAKLNVQIAEEARLMAIAKNAGTAAGRALAAFKALMKYDMSLARLRMRLNAAADGNPTDAQTQEQIDLHAKYEAALKELEAKTKEAEEAIARAEIAEQIARRMKEKEKRDKAGGKVKTKADRRLDAALEKLGKDLSFFSFTGAFQKLPQLIELAGALIEKNMERFEDFVSWTSKRWGKTPKPETLPVLRQAWDTAWEQEKHRKPPSPPKVSVERDIPDSLVNAAKILFRHFLEEGITNTEEVIDAVHSELQDQFPNLITERLDTMKAMVDYEKTITLSQDPLDILAADKRAIVQLKAKIEDMQRGIAPRRSEQRYPASDEQRAHIKMFNEEKRKGGFEVTDPDRQAKSALASLETRLRHSISDTLNEIASGARTVPEKTVQPTSDTTEDLQAYLALVRGMHKDIFGDRTMTQEQKIKAAEAAAVKNEAYWNDRLARAKAGDFSTGKAKPDPVTNANIAAIKARSELAKAQIQELRELANPKPSPEAISDARYLTSLQNQLSKKMDRMADIMARAAAGDFAPERNLSKEKREANAERRKKDAAIRDARIKLDETSRALNEQIEQVRKQNLTYVDLAAKVPGGIFSLVRDLAFGGELSFILKQGAPHVFGTLAPAGKIARAGYEAITGNPDAAKVKLRQARQGYGKLGRALAGSLRAMLWKTDTELARSQDEIKQRPNYKNGTYEAMKIPVDAHGGKFTVKEEVFLNNLVEIGGLALDKRFPGFKGFRDGHPVFTTTAHNLNLANRFSNATTVFMATIRADIADNAAEVWTMKRGQMTPAEARSLGRVNNMITGKGDINENALKYLNSIFISAPWLVSRLQMVLEPLLSLKPNSGRTAESRKIAAETYVDMAAGVAAYYSLFVLAGMFMDDDDEEKPVVEWDSTSSDFMKPRFGKTRLDPLFGLQQVIVLGSRIYHGTVKDSRGVVQKRDGNKDIGEFVWNFIDGRLHPAIQAGRSLWTGEDFMGQPITKTEVLMRMPVPVTYPDIVEASKNRGIPASIGFGMWGLAGGGLSTYDPRTKARADIVEELGIVQRKIQNQNTPADVRKSLQTDADKMLEEHLLNAVKHDLSYLGNTVVSEQLATREPGTSIAPELSEAIQKEKHDITLRALEMLSTEDTKKEKKPGEDNGITTARSLLRTMAPTYDEANALFEAAYKQRNGSLKELVGEKGHKRWQFKPSVTAARRRMKAIYEAK